MLSASTKKLFLVHGKTLHLVDPVQHQNQKICAQRSIFDEIRGIWIADETLSRVFDISSQSKHKLKSKQRSKIVKIYAN